MLIALFSPEKDYQIKSATMLYSRTLRLVPKALFHSKGFFYALR